MEQPRHTGVPKIEKALGRVRTSGIASQRLVPSGTNYAAFSSFSTAETELPTVLTAAFN
jgi:hypothetical protein